MLTLTKEVRYIQNPGLGAVLLWRFACGYCNSHPTSGHPPLQLAFIVLPIILHRETFALLKSTNRPTGLHGFADKFSRSDVGKSDVLHAIQPRALAWRSLSLDSLRLAVRASLLTVAERDAKLIPVSLSAPSGVPASVKPLLANAEKLGQWCSVLTLFEIGTVLKVAF